MKIALVSPYTFSHPGGVQAHVRALQEEFVHFGQEAKIILPGKPPVNSSEDWIYLGNTIRVPANSSMLDISFSLKPWVLKRLLDKEKFDVLHFHNISPLSLEILHFSKSANILTLHAALEGSNLLSHLPTLKSTTRSYLVKRIHGVILVSSFLSHEIDAYQGLVTTIPNGVDVQRFSSGFPLENFRDGMFNILFVGRIEKRKGLIYALRAFYNLKKIYPRLRFIVVGDGDQKKNCEAFVVSKGLKDVEFMGTVTDEDLPRFFAAADLFVAPATHGESFGIVLLEAMAAGLPIVAFANGGYRQVLKGKGAEFLVEPADTWGLTKKLGVLIQNEEKRREIGEWGRQEVKKYDWKKVASQVLDFYEQVLRGQGKNVGSLLR